MQRIGVRELRQHASKFLREVAAGVSIEITDRGRPVARLVPITADPWDDLVAAGDVVEAIRPMVVADLAPTPGARSASEALDRLRADER